MLKMFALAINRYSPTEAELCVKFSEMQNFFKDD